jgi:hypothetical protein
MIRVERRRTARLVGALLLGLLHVEAVAAQSGPAPEQSGYSASLSDSLSGVAKSEYEAAKLLYGDGDFAGAAIKFEHAYSESKDPRLLWNLAAAEKNQRHYARVLELIERYIVESGARLSTEERSEAQTVMNTVQSFVGSVTVTVNEGNAKVLVDEGEAGVSPLKSALRIDMGPHKIRAQKPGFSEASAQVMVQGGTASAVELRLQAELHQGRLRVVASPGAVISVDGKLAGTGEWGGVLASGVHGVSVTLEGKRPYQADVAVKDNQDQVLRVVLDPAAEPGPPKSTGVPTWVWIAGGGVLAAGLGVGAYFVFKPEDQIPVHGSLDTVEMPFTRARF